MATLALEYRVHGDGAGRDEEECSGERNSYRGAVEWMKVEVSWGRLLRVHFKTWCGRYDVSVKPTVLWVGLLHSGSVLLSFRRANGGFEMYSKLIHRSAGLLAYAPRGTVAYGQATKQIC